MAEQAQSQQQSSKLNDRTYQEVEYLKKNLGPILVAALAEICIRRPADPIEYLGHWLLRWRYNEELKRRDVQNALEVVRQKASSKDDESAAANPADANGFTPASPFPPPGYGGPLEGEQVAEGEARKSDPAAVVVGDHSGAGGAEEKRASQPGAAGSGEMKRASGGSDAAGRRVSGEPATASAEPVAEERRPSGEGVEEAAPPPPAAEHATPPEEEASPAEPVPVAE